MHLNNVFSSHSPSLLFLFIMLLFLKASVLLECPKRIILMALLVRGGIYGWIVPFYTTQDCTCQQQIISNILKNIEGFLNGTYKVGIVSFFFFKLLSVHLYDCSLDSDPGIS